MILDKFERVGILGFGREGLSAYSFLKSEYPNLQIAIFDKRLESDFKGEYLQALQDESLDLCLGEDYLEDLHKVEILIKSPGVNPRQPEIVRYLGLGGAYTTATNLFFERVVGKTICVTGSKGKSTTCSLMHAVLKAHGLKSHLVGNIGEPILNYLQDDAEDVFYIIEMSSQQLEDFRATVDIGVFTSFFADHMDYHGSLESYKDAKCNLFRNARLSLYNSGNQDVARILESLKVARKTSKDFGLEVLDESIVLDNHNCLSLSQLHLQGLHNLYNCVLTLMLSFALDLDLSKTVEAIQDFEPLEYRMQDLGKVNGIKFINDSASVTPESTVACLQAFAEQEVSSLIMGGLDRGYDYSILQEALPEDITIYVLANLQEKIQMQLVAFRIILVEDFTEALDLIIKDSKAGTICLFSPGAPSYNSFQDFYERGAIFTKSLESFGLN
ncbi:UDP-N-acetylmuramoyl-L-alanine--D-glutamate ligase [bacterium]|nr:UDP-N-acetylmuramoyl-L-alanine--D-glutamate ligase [bacterium]